MPSLADRLAAALAAWRQPRRLGTVDVTIDDVHDTTGWTAFGSDQTGRSGADVQTAYTDALTAWRKNPMAKRMVDTITDWCLGDGLRPAAPGQMGNFIERWWDHPKNNMELRLPELCDELCRAGDLFITLHRNGADGISYVRPIPKDKITKIETHPTDWETEYAYQQTTTEGLQVTTWLSQNNPKAESEEAIMLHYRVNGVVGSLMGESDLTTIVPWLLRYSRMLEDRVRLNWALKAFLWIVTVPTNLVSAKREQYNQPPEGGSVIVKDSSETWEPIIPNLHAFDARYDMHAVRQMIDAGTGFPPHWRGEGTDVNLATATAMERAATRHLRRRQLFLRTMIIDLAHVAYTRAYDIGRVRPVPNKALITVDTPDLSREDNKDLARAARDLAEGMAQLAATAGTSPDLRKRMIDLVFRFAGEQLSREELDELTADLAVPASTSPENPSSVPHSAGLPSQVGRSAGSPEETSHEPD